MLPFYKEEYERKQKVHVGDIVTRKINTDDAGFDKEEKKGVVCYVHPDLNYHTVLFIIGSNDPKKKTEWLKESYIEGTYDLVLVAKYGKPVQALRS